MMETCSTWGIIIIIIIITIFIIIITIDTYLLTITTRCERSIGLL